MEMLTIHRPRRRREIVCTVLLVLVFAVAGFLIGYFAMKNVTEDGVKCQSNDGDKPKPTFPTSNKEIYHKMFQDEIRAKNIENNLK